MVRPTILDEMIGWKRGEVERSMAALPLAAVQAASAGAPAPRDFVAALRQPGVSLIAEIKRASPSKGPLRPDLDPVSLAREYEAGGASAISVLTDERFFQGSLEDLRAVRQSVGLPVLRKDFVIHPYQVYQARAAGADAILLIVAALDDGALYSLQELAAELGMAVLVEVHSAAELMRALKMGPAIIGVNNRDLHTFEVNLDTTVSLRPLVPAGVALVSESGVRNRDDVARLELLGVDAILVGEALVRAGDVADKIGELVKP
jgi:indole-3-glycerol phosphate synthase